MKKISSFSTFAVILLLVVAYIVSCSPKDEATQPAETATMPAATIAFTATVQPVSDEPVITVSPVSSSSTVETDVFNIVVTAAEATLHGGSGDDYPVVAIAFKGKYYPVTGVSEDGLWWRLTCYNEASVEIDECWISSDRSIAMPAESTAPVSGSEIKPYVEVTFNFLRALQSGLTAAESDRYLSDDLQTVVDAGRPLPSLFGIRDLFPSFTLSDFTDNRVKPAAQIRVRFNYDNPTFAIVNLIQEDGEWQINSVAPHNLVRSFNTSELLRAEDVIKAYYRALADNEPEAAYNRLTAEAQTGTSPDALGLIAQGLDKLVVSTMQPVRAKDEQINYYVRLLAIPKEGQLIGETPLWHSGDNARWLTMVRTTDGWLIAQIINSPILADIESWQRASILPVSMTLEIPSEWTRASLGWAWSPNSLGVPAVGVSWAELGEYGGDETLLPRFRREISSLPIDLGWAQGTQYSFELMGGPGEGPLAAESHMVVKTGRRAYDFYAIASDIEELDSMRPILQRMVAAVSITDPDASAFNSVTTSVNFLASVLRDGTAVSSLPYLSEALRASTGDQSSFLSLLGVDSLFSSFNASWIDNPAPGQARVAVSMNFAGSTEEAVFTVERATDDSWLITDVKPVE